MNFQRINVNLAPKNTTSPLAQSANTERKANAFEKFDDEKYQKLINEHKKYLLYKGQEGIDKITEKDQRVNKDLQDIKRGCLVLENSEKNVFDFTAFDELSVARLSILQLFRNDKILNQDTIGSIIQVYNKYLSVEKINQLISGNSIEKIKDEIFKQLDKFLTTVDSIYVKDFKSTLARFNNMYHIIIFKDYKLEKMYDLLLSLFENTNGYFCRGVILKKNSYLSCLYRNSEGFTLFKGYEKNKIFKDYSEAFLAIVQESLIPVLIFYKRDKFSDSQKVSHEISGLYKKLILSTHLPKIPLAEISKNSSPETPVVSSAKYPEKQLIQPNPSSSRISPVSSSNLTPGNLTPTGPVIKSQSNEQVIPQRSPRIVQKAVIIPNPLEIPSYQTNQFTRQPYQPHKKNPVDSPTYSPIIPESRPKELTRISPLSGQKSFEFTDKSQTIGRTSPFSIHSPRSFENGLNIDNLSRISPNTRNQNWMCPECLNDIDGDLDQCACGYVSQIRGKKNNLCKICSQPAFAKLCRSCKSTGLDFCEDCKSFFRAERGVCESCGKGVRMKGKKSVDNTESKRCEICFKSSKELICEKCEEEGYWKCSHCSCNNKGGYICCKCSRYNLQRYKNMPTRVNKN